MFVSAIQKWAWGYAVLFVGVVSLGYIPGFTDSDGMLFGLFNIDRVDDALHLFSGLWAAFAALRSPKASRFYFRAFGIFYTADAFLGLFTGYAFTDLLLGRFGANAGHSMMMLQENIAVNLPHFLIGPIALILGFLFAPRWGKSIVTATN